MHPTDRNVALVFDEMSIKQSLVYNEGTDSVEGFEDFGNLDKLDTLQIMLQHLW